MALISQKDGELEAAQVALAAVEAKALLDIVATRAGARARKAAEVEVAVVRAEAEQAAEETVATV